MAWHPLNLPDPKLPSEMPISPTRLHELAKTGLYLEKLALVQSEDTGSYLLTYRFYILEETFAG